MRLLIDEMYTAAIAAQLRRAGHDAVAVTEDPDLVGLDDLAVCDVAVASGRAVVTENAADFLRVVRDRAAAGQPVPTLVITSNRTFPRHSPAFVGRAVGALGSFCDEHRSDHPLAGAVYWLRPADDDDPVR